MSINLDKIVCRFFAEGRTCHLSPCPFPHIYSSARKPDNVCRFFMKGMCRDNFCSFDHIFVTSEDSSEKLQNHEGEAGTSTSRDKYLYLISLDKRIDISKIYCRYFKENKCFMGPDCPFPHTTDPKLRADNVCRHFLLKFCKYGQSCKRYHINPPQEKPLCKCNTKNCRGGDYCKFSQDVVSNQRGMVQVQDGACNTHLPKNVWGNAIPPSSSKHKKSGSVETEMNSEDNGNNPNNNSSSFDKFIASFSDPNFSLFSDHSIVPGNQKNDG